MTWRPHPMQTPLEECPHHRFKAWYTNASTARGPFLVAEHVDGLMGTVERFRVPYVAKQKVRALCAARCRRKP